MISLKDMGEGGHGENVGILVIFTAPAVFHP